MDKQRERQTDRVTFSLTMSKAPRPKANTTDQSKPLLQDNRGQRDLDAANANCDQHHYDYDHRSIRRPVYKGAGGPWSCPPKS